MFKKTLLKHLNDIILDESIDIKSKIDIFVQQVNSLMNKQELLLKAINEDRLVITKILEHMEKLENEIYNRNTSNRSNTTKSSSKRKTRWRINNIHRTNKYKLEKIQKIHKKGLKNENLHSFRYRCNGIR